MYLRVALTSAFVALAITAASPAEAALTSSEKAQIRDFVASGKTVNAPRVRALVARTDLSADESAEALSAAVVAVPFDDTRAAFLRDLAFGVSSDASRPLLVQIVTKGLLARADAVFRRYVGGLDHEPRAVAELVAIYAFIDGAIANAGKPTFAAHDPNAGITAAAYEKCAAALRAHIDDNARWLKGEGVIAETVARARAQAQIAFFDMLPDGLTRRVDAADRLGLTGARRAMLVEWGILFADAGKLDDAKVELVRKAMARLPGARADVSLVFGGVDRSPLRARGVVAFVGGPSKGTAGEATPFGPEVTPSAKLDGEVSAIVEDLAVMSVTRALDNRPELRAQANLDATATRGDASRVLGKPEAPSVEHVVGAAAHLLMLDAPRTLDLAFTRALGGKPEGAALLSDAVGALAVFAAAPAGDKSGPGLRLELGKGSSSVTMSAIRLAPDGTAAGFTLEGHTFTIERAGGARAVSGILRDGTPLLKSHLGTRVPTAEPAPTKATKP